MDSDNSSMHTTLFSDIKNVEIVPGGDIGIRFKDSRIMYENEKSYDEWCSWYMHQKIPSGKVSI